MPFKLKNPSGIWFWVREALNSQAEVDYVIAPKANPIPIEVKSGATGLLRSLRSYMQAHPSSTTGYRLFEGKAEKGTDGIIDLPLYLAQTLGQLERA
ncbi:MAG: hypothetical protein ABIW76_19585 [Fibrobacteria bacterium]